MKNTIVQQCLDILQKEDIKNEIRKIVTNITTIALSELNPYIYIISLFGVLLFLLNVAIIILLLLILRNK
jgi:hypothetical protein